MKSKPQQINKTNYTECMEDKLAKIAIRADN